MPRCYLAYGGNRNYNIDMLEISSNITIPESELLFQAIRAQGSGGQKVNKTSSAIHLRFDIKNSTLPDFYKERLLNFKDSRITNDGVVVIKAQQYRTLEKNKQDALERLRELIKNATVITRSRRATKPSRNSQKRRMDSKTKHSNLKKLRKNTDY